MLLFPLAMVFFSVLIREDMPATSALLRYEEVSKAARFAVDKLWFAVFARRSARIAHTTTIAHVASKVAHTHSLLFYAFFRLIGTLRYSYPKLNRSALRFLCCFSLLAFVALACF